MASPEHGGWKESLAKTGEKAGIVTAAVGLLLESTPVVALGVLGFLAGKWALRDAQGKRG